jgi:D-alanyl-lipoteichoic acid acyltransferase DltB (MBOAT superfamily)
LAALGYFKYANFFIDQINNFGADVDWHHVIMPLAISFYTFQQIAYLVDCRRGEIHDNTLIRYIFLVTFFPHLIAGRSSASRRSLRNSKHSHLSQPLKILR